MVHGSVYGSVHGSVHGVVHGLVHGLAHGLVIGSWFMVRSNILIFKGLLLCTVDRG